ncbi:unnamed protein product [Closterium sp. NIES-64]|nr:unnamed protein product [Closterium sp. NIES-64]
MRTAHARYQPPVAAQPVLPLAPSPRRSHVASPTSSLPAARAAYWRQHSQGGGVRSPGAAAAGGTSCHGPALPFPFLHLFIIRAPFPYFYRSPTLPPSPPSRPGVLHKGCRWSRGDTPCAPSSHPSTCMLVVPTLPSAVLKTPTPSHSPGLCPPFSHTFPFHLHSLYPLSLSHFWPLSATVHITAYPLGFLVNVLQYHSLMRKSCSLFKSEIRFPFSHLPHCPGRMPTSHPFLRFYARGDAHRSTPSTLSLSASVSSGSVHILIHFENSDLFMALQTHSLTQVPFATGFLSSLISRAALGPSPPLARRAAAAHGMGMGHGMTWCVGYGRELSFPMPHCVTLVCMHARGTPDMSGAFPSTRPLHCCCTRYGCEEQMGMRRRPLTILAPHLLLHPSPSPPPSLTATTLKLTRLEKLTRLQKTDTPSES